MKTRGVRCWKAQSRCTNNHHVELWFTVPDFGDQVRLFTCRGCGEVFAVDPDAEFYAKKPFDSFRRQLSCPRCHRSLADILPYPDSFVCPQCNEVQPYARADRSIPLAEDSVIHEFFDPYSE